VDESQVREIVKQAVQRAVAAEGRAAPGPGADRRPEERPRRRRVVSEEQVRDTAVGANLEAPADAVVTPLARALARERRVGIGQGEDKTAAQASPGRWNRVVALGADHGGFEMKEDLRGYVKELGYLVKDCGTLSADPVDYPDFAVAVAASVAGGECAFGIMVDGAGIGSCMVANKVPGVRAAMCYDLASARNSREHNDANVLTLGGRMVTRDMARQIVKVFLEASCTEERHLKRVRKIMDVERRYQRA
jgi:ribose 5-phosphate isomerase B